MATHLDLEEQEQLDQLKHFWKQYGNLISGVLTAVLLAFAAWNGYQYWQRSQATQAAAMYDEVERAAQAGDMPRLERAASDMRDKFGGTTYAQQAALLSAIARMKQKGTSFVIITHRTNVLRVIDKILLMRDGQQHLYGPRDEVLAALSGAPANNRQAVSAG